MGDIAADTTKTYRGNCICAAFIFEVAVPEIKELMACNCSICYKKAYALGFADAKDFKVVKGDIKDLAVYKFGNQNLSHMFCPKCGITVAANYSMMPDKMGFSMRALQGPLDLWSLPKKPYDGKALAPGYTAPSFDDMPEPVAEVEGGKVYHGSCHCGDVRVALRTKPIQPLAAAEGDAADGSSAAAQPSAPLQQITECNCSNCQRLGGTWIYPHRDQVVIRTAEPSMLSTYPMRMINNQFCARCGVCVARPFAFKTDEEFERLPEKARAYLADKRHVVCVNLRLFQEVDVGAVKVDHFDGYNIIQPLYVNP